MLGSEVAKMKKGEKFLKEEVRVKMRASKTKTGKKGRSDE
jgi:hypothetical protein